MDDKDKIGRGLTADALGEDYAKQNPHIVEAQQILNYVAEEAGFDLLVKGSVSSEDIRKSVNDYLEQVKGQNVSKITTEITHAEYDPLKGCSWTMKVSVPPGYLDPEVEAEWRRKNELEKTQSETSPKTP